MLGNPSARREDDPNLPNKKPREGMLALLTSALLPLLLYQASGVAVFSH